MNKLVEDEMPEGLLGWLHSAKLKAAGGLSRAEMGELFHEAIWVLVHTAEGVGGTGAEKKALVLAWLGYVIDQVLPMVPVPMFYRPFQPLVQPYTKKLLLWMADGLIDMVVRRMNDQPSLAPLKTVNNS